MRALVQRVLEAEVRVAGQSIGRIGPGVLTLLGVARDDSEAQLEKIIQKALRLRIFEDEAGRMNRSLVDIGGEHLIVSQFTLCADTKKGNRPSFVGAEVPEKAKLFYEKAIRLSEEAGVVTQSGEFGADMKVSLVNDGPVTLMLEE